MRLHIALLLFWLLAAADGHSQQIQAYKTFGGMRFEMDSLTLTHRQVSDLLYDNPEASKVFRQAKAANVVAGVLGFTGAFMLAFPVGSAIAGGNPEWGLAAGGALLVIASIPFSISYQRKSSSAIDTYNSGNGSKARLYVKGAAIGIKF